MITFFVFLLGRQICYHYFHLEQVYEYLDVTNNLTYICLIISLIGLIIGLGLSSSKLHIVDKKIIGIFDKNEKNILNYQCACKTVFYICYIGMLFGTLLQIIFVQAFGYLYSYTSGTDGAGIPTVIIYLSRFAPIALCLYLATKPPKSKAIMPLILYEIYAILTVFTGQRFPFVAISMFVLYYYILRSRDEDLWIKKYHYYLIILSLPALLGFLTVYDSIRVGSMFQFEGFVEAVQKFLIQQGGSINVIRRTILNADQLNDMNFVSFSSIYSAVFENGIVRRLLNIAVYSGNSIDRAFETNNLAHRLSYIAYGTGYLSGRGTGSSYIAELYHDFNLVGVFLGNVFYGFLLHRIDKITFTNIVFDGFKLAMVYHLLFAPRGSFDAFIGNVFTFQSVIGFGAILLLKWLLEKRKGLIILKKE